VPEPALNPYDELPYVDLPFPQTHPARLAVLARLFGLSPPDVATCRVLELGCASGANLIPMAAVLPAARFVGVDLSGEQIARGNALVESLGLANIELRRADIAEIGRDYGEFDYIVAHGVYSWVPPPIRDKLLSICRANLAPDGVAYVSYNTQPGWSTHGQLREMMLLAARGAENAAERVRKARAMLEFLGEAMPATSPHGALLREEAERLRREADAYLFHDHMERDNAPVWFHRFAAEAAEHGLQYLSESDFSAMGLSGFAPQTLQAMRQLAPELTDFEQLTDLFRNRSFRQTLLAHAEAPVDRRLSARTLAPFEIASAVTLEPSGTDAGATPLFRARTGKTFGLANPLTRSALRALIDRWPEGVALDALYDSARAMPGQVAAGAGDPAAARKAFSDEVLQLYAAGIVQLRLWSPPVTNAVAERPAAGALARLQATRGGPVTNLLHQPMAIDAFDRALIPLLDGTRDVAALAAEMSAAGFPIAESLATSPGGVAANDEPAYSLRENLERLARAGLLMRQE
jgi:SAM-dependent methyltransferase